MRKLAKETGRPVWFLLTDRYEDPERWRRLIKAVHAARAEGLPLTAQMAGRPIGVMMGIGTALNPFTVRPSYKQLESLPIEEQRRRLRDPEMRRKSWPTRRPKPKSPSLRSSARSSPSASTSSSSWAIRRTTSPARKRASPRSRSAKAAAPDEVAYDYMLEDGQYLYFPVVNYVTGDHEPIREMLNDPACLLGLTDGGAHCTSIIDAGLPSYMLAHWGRDRRAGRACRWSFWSSARPARPPISSGCTTAAGSRRGCAPTST